MIGVAQHNIGTKFAHWVGYMALTVPAVPTGMKAGVLMAPLGVSMRPNLAVPSVFRSSNFTVILRARFFSTRQKARITVRIKPIAFATASA